MSRPARSVEADEEDVTEVFSFMLEGSTAA